MSTPRRTSIISLPVVRPSIFEGESSRARMINSSYTEDLHRPSTEPHLSPTINRSLTYHPNESEVRERQRAMDVDSAMQLSRARTIVPGLPTHHPDLPPHSISVSPTSTHAPILENGGGSLNDHPRLEPDDEDEKDGILDIAHELNTPAFQHLSFGHDPSLLASASAFNESEKKGFMAYRPNIDFSLMEAYAAEENTRLYSTGSAQHSNPVFRDALKPPQSSRPPVLHTTSGARRTGNASNDIISLRAGQRPPPSLSNNISRPRREGGKIALFEGLSGAPPPALVPPIVGRLSTVPSFDQSGENTDSSRVQLPAYSEAGHDRQYRFSFYSNAASATIHARNLSELPAPGQSFEDLFSGVVGSDEYKCSAADRPHSAARPPNGNGLLGDHRWVSTANPVVSIGEPCTWWLDVTSPTDEEMKLLSKVFNLHPLTTEDIQVEEAREKIELFRNYYFVCFRSFDQDQYSPTYLEPLNMYIVVFREGTLSFHFRPTAHPQNVRRRIKQLRDYISVTSDWISYALIDDITDGFGPLIQGIEYEVDTIDELVLILKDTEQGDMLRRIGTCRKKVMGLLRLMGNKADVVKGLAKRCNEQWSVAPKSDIGLYLSDIQDHLITMTQNLNHYEKILSRSHSNYLAQISIEMTEANNKINDVLSKLTALGTILLPMNLVTGLFGMNVEVPGKNPTTLTWFFGILGFLAAFALFGGVLTYKFMVMRRR